MKNHRPTKLGILKCRLTPLLLFLSLACSEGEKDSSNSKRRVLSPLTNLEEVASDQDPLPGHRPEEIDCNTLVGWTIEEGLLEVNTAECNYLALSEPAAINASAGSELTTRISYFDLTASEMAEAHLALFVRETLIWETIITIPSSADVMELSIDLPVDVKKGDAIGFHLHNHGQNTWNIEQIFVAGLDD